MESNEGLAPFSTQYLHAYIQDVILKSLNPSKSIQDRKNIPELQNLLNLNESIQSIINQYFDQAINGFIHQFAMAASDDSLPEEHGRPSLDLQEFPISDHEKPTDEKASFDEMQEMEQPVLPIMEKDDSQINSEHSSKFPDDFKPQENRGNIHIRPDVITTDDKVLININMPEDKNKEDVKVSIYEGYVSIKWVSDFMEQLIPVPFDVLQNKRSIAYHGNIIQIALPRGAGQGE